MAEILVRVPNSGAEAAGQLAALPDGEIVLRPDAGAVQTVQRGIQSTPTAEKNGRWRDHWRHTALLVAGIWFKAAWF